MLPSFTDTSALDWLNLSIPHLNVRSAFNAKKASDHIRKDAIESFLHYVINLLLIEYSFIPDYKGIV